MHSRSMSDHIPRLAGKNVMTEPMHVTSGNGVEKAQVGLYMRDSLTIGCQDDRIVTLDIRPIRDREPAEKAPAEGEASPRHDPREVPLEYGKVYPEEQAACGEGAPGGVQTFRGCLPCLLFTDPLGLLYAEVGASGSGHGPLGAEALVSLPEEAPASTKRERIVEAIEREIERLKQLRPGLEPRIDRASHILVVHLA